MGLPAFNAQFSNPEAIYRPMLYITVLSIVTYITPLIIVDIIALFSISWGFQLLINCIESLILTIVLFILIMIEFVRLKKTMNINNDLMYINSKKFDNSYSYAINPEPNSSTLALIQVDKPYGFKNQMLDSELKRKELKGLINRMNEPVESNYLVRSESFKDFREIDEAWAPNKQELMLEKCITYPCSDERLRELGHHLFLDEEMDVIREQMKNEFMFDNVYTDDYTNEEEEYRSRLRVRKTQTRAKDYSQTVDDISSDASGYGKQYEEMEVDANFAPSLFTDVLEHIEEDDGEDALARRANRQQYKLGAKRKKKVPKFDIDDILGKFDTDEYGNYIIIREKDGKLYDKKGRLVNKRGYLVDNEGNVVNKHGKIILVGERGAINNKMGYEEVNSDEDIPPPYSFQKRKKRLLNQDYKTKLKKKDRLADIEDLDDEAVVEGYLNDAKNNSKKYLSDFSESLMPSRRKRNDKDSEFETSIESLMAVNPNSYYKTKRTKRSGNKNSNRGASSGLSERIINITTKHPPRNYVRSISKIVENKRAKKRKKTNARIRQAYFSPSVRINSQSVRPPKALKRDATQELFPNLSKKKLLNQKSKKLIHSSSQDGIYNKNLKSKRNKLLSGASTQMTNKDMLNTRKMNESNLDNIEEAHDSLASERRSKIKKYLNLNEAKKRSKSKEKFNISQYRKKVVKKQRPNTGIKKVYGNVDKFLIKSEDFELADIDSGRGMMKSFIDTSFYDPETAKNLKLLGLESIYTQRLQVRPSTSKSRSKMSNTRFLFESRNKLFKPITNNLVNEKSTKLDIISDDKLESDEVEQINNFAYTRKRNTKNKIPKQHSQSTMNNSKSRSYMISRVSGSRGPERRIEEGGWV